MFTNNEKGSEIIWKERKISNCMVVKFSSNSAVIFIVTFVMVSRDGRAYWVTFIFKVESIRTTHGGNMITVEKLQSGFETTFQTKFT